MYRHPQRRCADRKVSVMTGSTSYRSILHLSIPLVMSMAAITVMEFTDRVFLANYSLDAIAASLPAGITAHLFIALFFGVAEYLNVFVAQYSGAGQPRRVGPCLWQGLWFSLIAMVILCLISLAAEPLFRLSGHAPAVQELEVIYFHILCWGGGIHVAGAALSCYFSGRGKTRPVMVVNIAGVLLNIPLDYAMINGLGPFPEMGITGAAIATVVAWGVMTFLFALLIFRREQHTLHGVFYWRPDRQLLARILRYGVPGSFQFCMDIMAFTLFVLIVGRIGTLELAVTNIVFSINSMAFMPTVGFSLGVSTLVGQAIGRDDAGAAVQAALRSLHLMLVYIFCMGIVFLLFPEPLLALFSSEKAPIRQTLYIMDTGRLLLRVVTAYILFDACYMVFGGVLKGAGDTAWLMGAIGLSSVFVMILPLLVGVVWLGAGVYYAWGCVLVYIVTLFSLVLWRYSKGRWKTMRVIERKSA